MCVVFFFFSSRRRHTRCALVTGVQTCALPIYRARFHRLGEPLDRDVTLYEETEEKGFSVGVGKSHDRSLVIIATGDNSSTEVRFVSADDPTAPLTLVSRRSEERSVGKEGVSTCRSRCAPYY